MYKDLYKRANDRINTKEPFEKFIKNLPDAPQNIGIARKAEYAAALAACVALTFAGTKVLKRDIKITHDPIASYEEKEDTAEIQGLQGTQKSTVEITGESGNEIAGHTENADTSKKQAFSAKTGTTDENIANSTVITEESIVEDAASGKAARAFESTDSDEQSPEIYSAGGAAVSGTLNEECAEDTDGVLEYSTRFAVAADENPQLPEGVFQTFSSEDENGSVFTFEGNGKKAEVRISTDASKAQQYLKAQKPCEKIYISGIPAAILSDNAHLEVYMTHKNTAYTASTDGFTKAELEKLISSLIRN